MTSIVIPALDEGARLAATLVSLAGQEGDFEVVVCWAGDCAWPPSVPYPLRAEPARAVGRAAQLNQGARAARGDALVFLHADTVLPPGALREAEHLLANPGVAGGAWRLAFDHAHPALALLSRLSALRWRAAYYGDQGFFCRRRDFEAVGGFPDVPLLEDVELARALRGRGRLARAPGIACTSARRFTARGPWRQLGVNAAIVAGHWLGVPAAWLARAYS